MDPTDDALTGLRDRHGFLLELRRQVEAAARDGAGVAVLVVDVNGFAAVNGAHGYDFGDRLLRHLALQLRAVARAQDIPARIGDDRFAILLPRIMGEGHAELAAQKLLRLLELPFESGGSRVRVAVTVGIALYPGHAAHPEHLLRKAEAAVTAARAAGRASQFAASAGPADGAGELWEIEVELAGALQRGEISMHYQPKLRSSDLRPVGVEALMRWQSPSRGALHPDVFIPIAERCGHIKTLTIWAMNTALRQAGQWRHPFGELSVAVNIPAAMVVQDDLPDLVEHALNLWKGEQVRLMLEITERSLVAAPEHSFRVLSRIREMGVGVSIDDFGTGYSCLAYFRNIPADELKIDRSFVSGLLEDNASAELTGLIIELAHRFGLSVVGEGIENEATLDALRRLRCDVVQGFLFGKAIASPELQGWLERAARA
jgi:diguanylate cyclase (GGDEF)-like protein